jgi:hypothetical protein
MDLDIVSPLSCNIESNVPLQWLTLTVWNKAAGRIFVGAVKCGNYDEVYFRSA